MRNALSVFLVLLSCAVLFACKSQPKTNAPAVDTFKVTAELLYRERILVPEGSTLVAELRDVSIADKAAETISEEIIGLGGGIQLPIDVTLETVRSKLQPGHTYALHARILNAQGDLMWITTTSHRIDTQSPSQDLGIIVLEKVQSGTVTAADSFTPFQAQGNEPGWSVNVQKDKIEILTNYGNNKIDTPRPEPQPYKGGYKYHVDTESHIVIIDVRRKLCYDDMSGRPHPARVTLTLDGTTYEGCGGDPKSLLTGVEWVVEDIAEKGIIDRSRITINFDEKGRAHGLSSCNSYSAVYELTGETLTFKNPLSTLKACATALMNQEHTFLQKLQQVTQYDIDGYGALILTTKSGETITARQ